MTPTIEHVALSGYLPSLKTVADAGDHKCTVTGGGYLELFFPRYPFLFIFLPPHYPRPRDCFIQ